VLGERLVEVLGERLVELLVFNQTPRLPDR
jgi:hypothetical protein